MGFFDLNFIMFCSWSVGIIAINVYLSYVLDHVRTITKSFYIHFLADILISALAGVITYLLAKTIHLEDIYLVMVAAVIGHLSARVVYKSILLDVPTEEIYSTFGTRATDINPDLNDDNSQSGRDTSHA